MKKVSNKQAAKNREIAKIKSRLPKICPNDEWRDVVGFEGLYVVNRLGVIKGVERLVRNSIYGTERIVPERILVPGDNSRGYMTVNLSKRCIVKRYYVHRIVGEAFIPNDDPATKRHINHKNEIKSDNRAENLEWCTPSYNLNYGSRTEKQKATCKERGLHNAEKEICQYTLDGKYITSYCSIVEAAKAVGILEESIRISGKNENKRGGNFLWRYAPSPPTIKPYVVGGHFRRVVQMDMSGAIINEFKSLTEASISTKSNLSKISMCCKGKRDYTNGYKWEYKV